MKKGRRKKSSNAGRKRSAKGGAAKGPSPAKRSRTRASGETSGETSGAAPPLIPQEHGGALLAGGQPGHKGGGGRPPSEARALALEKFTARGLERLDKIANGELTTKVIDKEGVVHEIPPPIKEQRLALEAMARLGGMATKIELEAPVSPLVVQVLVGPEVAREMGE